MMRALVLASMIALPAAAQDTFADARSLAPEVAERMAAAARQACRDAGFQVGVTVVDRGGAPQVFLGDRFAGLHVYDTSRRKAWTAVSFRMATSDLATATQPGEIAFGIRQLDGPLALGGGLPVMAGDGSLVAGIGVSGAPSPTEDEVCAQAGIDEVAMDIAFGE
jgi:uncharacterized protein GlcG (DUF336 family)